jgi:hypothetical protein
MKLVGTQCFNADLHPFVSKHDGKLHYESGIIKENLCSVLKIFTVELSYGQGNSDSNMLALIPLIWAAEHKTPRAFNEYTSWLPRQYLRVVKKEV